MFEKNNTHKIILHIVNPHLPYDYNCSKPKQAWPNPSNPTTILIWFCFLYLVGFIQNPNISLSWLRLLNFTTVVTQKSVFHS